MEYVYIYIFAELVIDVYSGPKLNRLVHLYCGLLCNHKKVGIGELPEDLEEIPRVLLNEKRKIQEGLYNIINPLLIK